MGTNWPPRARQRGRRLAVAALLSALLLAGGAFAAQWIGYRYSHSLSRDAFLESDLINISSYATGDIVEIFVQEQSPVRKGQLLARIDPAVYRHEVDLKKSQRMTAESALRKAEADLKVLVEEMPRRVRIAERRLAIAQEQEARAVKALAFTTEDVEKGIRAAAAVVAANQAALVLAEEDYHRYRDLYESRSASLRKYQEATKIHDTARAEVAAAEARLAQAEAKRHQIDIARKELQVARHAVEEAKESLELARVGDFQIEAAKRLVAERTGQLENAREALRLGETNLGYTRIVAPYDGIITKKWRHLGDHVRPGDPLFNLYNPELLYVTVHLEETLLEGISLGNYATVQLDAFREPFQARVVWIGSATDANFSLIPRDVSAGEFTYVVQRVTTRLLLEPDERRPLLKPGLSAHVAIEHGPGDADWAETAWQQLLKLSGVREVRP